MVKDFLENYNKNSMMMKYSRGIHLTSIPLLVIAFIFFISWCFTPIQYKIAYLLIALCILVLFSLSFCLCYIKTFCNKYGSNLKNLKSKDKIRQIIWAHDREYILNYLKQKKLLKYKQIKLLIDEIRTYHRTEPRKDKIITKLFIITNIINSYFFICNYRNINNQANYLEATKLILVLFIVLFIFIAVINAWQYNISFFKETFSTLKSKNNDYELLIHILNDILITENFENDNLKKKENNCIIENIINKIFDWFR